MGKPRLERKLSFWDAFFFEVGGIIGAGVFVLLNLATAESGPSIVLAVALGGIVSVMSALCYAELSSALPKEGGEYAFARHLISKRAGLLVGAGWLVADVVSSAVVAIGFASYFTLLVPHVPLRAGAVLALLLVTAVNVLGAKLGARANNAVSLLKLAALSLFIVAALSRFQPAFFSPFLPHGVPGLLGGAALFFFAFSGFGKVTRLAEEVKNAPTELPRAILAGLGVSTLFYLLAALALVGSVGAAAAGASNSTLASVLDALGMHPLAVLLSLGALAATSSVLLTNNAGLSRILYALGRQYPQARPLGELHPRFGTPWKALLACGLVSSVVVFFSGIRQVAELSSVLFLLYYAALNGFVLLARRRADWRPRFKLPFHPWLPLAGIAACLLLLGGLLLNY